VSWPPTLEAFKQMVAEEWGLEPRQLESRARIQSLVRPRQAAMYLAREVGHYPLMEIGQAFRRDHSTVNHAIQVVHGRLIMDREFKAKVDVVVDQLAELRHELTNNVGKRVWEVCANQFPHGCPHGSHGESSLSETQKEVKNKRMRAPEHIVENPTTATEYYNTVLEALYSIPDPRAKVLLWRAWKAYCTVLVNRAIRNGKLTRLSCEWCTASKAEAHHPDYRNPYHVIWLCDECHRTLEREMAQ
jgi:hypothetical protein